MAHASGQVTFERCVLVRSDLNVELRDKQSVFLNVLARLALDLVCDDCPVASDGSSVSVPPWPAGHSDVHDGVGDEDNTMLLQSSTCASAL